MWYRIKCENLKPGQLAEVYSIDLGIVAFLSFRNMKKLPVEFLFHPSHVYRCILGAVFYYSFILCGRFIYIVLKLFCF